MIGRVVIASSLLVACGFEGVPPGNVPVVDGAMPPCASFSVQLDTCAQPFGGRLDLDGAYTFDTATGTLAKAGSPVDVVTATVPTRGELVTAIFAEDVRLASGTTIRADGPHAFAIVSRASIRFDAGARIDVSAGGAGARATCPVGAESGADNNGGGGGGGGGGFGGTGGMGGRGNAGASGAGIGGALIVLPPGPLGGCAGAAGGNGDDDDAGGAGGRGGGAVYLVAAERIELATSAGIHAGGGGGGGGAKLVSNFGDAGGGGGGSGGMILLEANAIDSSGILAANGGGGGEASGNGSAGLPGVAGLFAMERAPGGSTGSPTGSDGGGGGHHLVVDGGAVTAQQDGGGGGGGGGVGFVEAVADEVMLGTLVSPPAS